MKDDYDRRWNPINSPQITDCAPELIQKGFSHLAEANFKFQDFPFSNVLGALTTFNDSLNQINSFLSSSDIAVALQAYCINDDITVRNCGASLAQQGQAKYFFETYLGYPGCDTCFIPLSRVGSAPFVNCPGCQIPGTIISNFSAIRTSIGEADNDNNGYPDNQNYVRADNENLNLKMAMLGDTIRTTTPFHIYHGDNLTLQQLKNSGKNPKYLYMNQGIVNGNLLSLISSTIYVRRGTLVDSITVFGNDNAFAKAKLSGTSLDIMYNLSLDTLQKYLSSSVIDTSITLNNYNFIVSNLFRVSKYAAVGFYDLEFSGNAFVRVQPQTLGTNYFTIPTMLAQDLSNIANINNLGMQCENYGGNMRIIMPQLVIGNGQDQNNPISSIGNATNCENAPVFFFSLRTGRPKRDNFPFEYRNMGQLDTLFVEIPQGYELRNTIQIQWARKSGIATFAYNQPRTYIIAPVLENGRFKIPIRQLYNKFTSAPLSTDTLLALSDESSFVTIQLFVNPICGAVSDTSTMKPISASLSNLHFFGDTLIEKLYKINPLPNPLLVANDNVSYFPETKRFVISSNLSMSNQATASNGVAKNAFLKLESVNKRILVDSVSKFNPTTQVWTKERYPNPTAAQPVGRDSIIQLGAFVQNTTRQYKIHGRYVCDNSYAISSQTDSLRIIFGWNCDGYPANNLASSCISGLDTVFWQLNPRDAGLAMNTKIESNGQLLENLSINSCDSVSVRIKINSTSLGKIYGLNSKVKIELPSSLIYKANTSQILLGNNLLSTSEPTTSGDTLIWILNNSQLTSGYSSGDSSIYVKAKFVTNCSFGNNAIIKTRVNAETYCGGATTISDSVSVYIRSYTLPDKDTLLVNVPSIINTTTCSTLTIPFTFTNVGNFPTRPDNFLTVFGNTYSLPVLVVGQTYSLNIDYTLNSSCGSNTYNWSVANTDTTSCLGTVCIPTYLVENGSITINTTICNSIPIIEGNGLICHANDFENYTISNPIAGFTYSWQVFNADVISFTNTSITVMPSITNYSIKVSGFNKNTWCATDTTIKNVSVAFFNSFEILGKTDVCAEEINTYSISNPDNNKVYSWIVNGATMLNNFNNSVIIEASNTNYYVSAFARDKATNCYSDTVTMLVNVFNMNNVNIVGASNACLGENISLNIHPTSLQQNTTYTWYVGSQIFQGNSINFVASQVGNPLNIDVIATNNQLGCEAYGNHSIVIQDTSQFKITSNRFNYCKNTPALFYANPNNSSINWNFGSNATILSVTNNNYLISFSTEGYHTIIANYNGFCQLYSDTLLVYVHSCECVEPTSANILGVRGTTTTYDANGSTINYNQNSYLVNGNILLKNGTFNLAPNTTFYVKSWVQNEQYYAVTITLDNATLNLNGATITAACDTMWGGIVLIQNSKLNTYVINGDSAEISKAITAITAFNPPNSTSTFNNQIKIRGTRFINNRTALDFNIRMQSVGNNQSFIKNSSFSYFNLATIFPDNHVASIKTYCGIQLQNGNFTALPIDSCKFNYLHTGIRINYAAANVQKNSFRFSESTAIIGYLYDDDYNTIFGNETIITENTFIQHNDNFSPRAISVSFENAKITNNTIIGVGQITANNNSYGIYTIPGTNVKVSENNITNTRSAVTLFPLNSNTQSSIYYNNISDNKNGVRVLNFDNFITANHIRCNNFSNQSTDTDNYAIYISQGAFISSQGSSTAGPNNSFAGFQFDVLNLGNDFDYFAKQGTEQRPTVTGTGTIIERNASTSLNCISGGGRINNNNPNTSAIRASAIKDSIRLQHGNPGKIKEMQGELLKYYFPKNAQFQAPQLISDLQNWLLTLPPCNLEAFNSFALQLHKYYIAKSDLSNASHWESELKLKNPNYPEIEARIKMHKYLHGSPNNQPLLQEIALSNTAISEAAFILHQSAFPHIKLTKPTNTYIPFQNTSCNPNNARFNSNNLDLVTPTNFEIIHNNNYTLLVAPNPTNSVTFITVSHTFGKLTLTEPVSGKIIFEKDINSSHIPLSLEDYSAGMYILSWEHDNQIISKQKIIHIK
jgi:hypothetical protein